MPVDLLETFLSVKKGLATKAGPGLTGKRAVGIDAFRCGRRLVDVSHIYCFNTFRFYLPRQFSKERRKEHKNGVGSMHIKVFM